MTDKDNGLMLRMNRAEGRLRALETGYATLHSDVDHLGNRKRDLQRDVINMERRLLALQTRCDELERRLISVPMHLDSPV